MFSLVLLAGLKVSGKWVPEQDSLFWGFIPERRYSSKNSVKKQKALLVNSTDCAGKFSRRRCEHLEACKMWHEYLGAFIVDITDSSTRLSSPVAFYPALRLCKRTFILRCSRQNLLITLLLTLWHLLSCSFSAPESCGAIHFQEWEEWDGSQQSLRT